MLEALSNFVIFLLVFIKWSMIAAAGFMAFAIIAAVLGSMAVIAYEAWKGP